MATASASQVPPQNSGNAAIPINHGPEEKPAAPELTCDKRAFVTYISPAVWFSGGTFHLTIMGTGFNTKSAATKNCPETVVTANTDQGTVGIFDVIVVDSHTIKATIVVPVDAPAMPARIILWGRPLPPDTP